MSLFRTDPLLAFCRLFTWIILLSAICGFVAAIGLMVAVALNGDFAMAVVRRAYPQMHEAGLRVALVLGLLFLAVAMAMAARFMRHLLAVIRSVAGSEAFTLGNARHIRAMAWISLAALPVEVLIGVAFSRAVHLIGPRAPEAGFRIVVPHDGGYGQVLMTLLLFVLARLFTQAAAMRDEIEGTV